MDGWVDGWGDRQSAKVAVKETRLAVQKSFPLGKMEKPYVTKTRVESYNFPAVCRERGSDTR